MYIFIGCMIFFYTILNTNYLFRCSEWKINDRRYWIHIWPIYVVGGMAAGDWIAQGLGL